MKWSYKIFIISKEKKNFNKIRINTITIFKQLTGRNFEKSNKINKNLKQNLLQSIEKKIVYGSKFFDELYKKINEKHI